MAVGKLPVRSCLIDGEAIVCDENDFDPMRPEVPAAIFATTITVALLWIYLVALRP
jgi:hypothetical protein